MWLLLCSPLLLARTAFGGTWDRLLLRAACFCLFWLRRFVILVTVVDFLFDRKHEHLGFGGNKLCFYVEKNGSHICQVLSSERPSHRLLSRIQQRRVSQRENWISSVLDGWRSIPRRCVSFADIFRKMTGKARPLCFLTTRGVRIVDTNLPLVHWSKHANSKRKGVESLLLAYHNFAIYFQKKQCQHYTTPYRNTTVCLIFLSTCLDQAGPTPGRTCKMWSKNW